MAPPKIALEIEYHLEGQPDIAAEKERFCRAASWICERVGLKSLTASIAIVDDPTIHRINRDHLNHDWPTDVISFVFDANDDSVNGEVIASYDTAARLAVKAGWATEDELLLYVAHGLLHLAGFDDIEEQDRQKMRSAEMDLLTDLGIQGSETYLKTWHQISY
ncbi:MAG: rRNA maturation RNase YbeY [Planctomycetota bacterium]